MNLGQLLIIGFDGTEMSPRLASLLTRIQPAGVILFARNITGAEQTYRLLRACQKYVATRLFACVDLEGGTVDRLKKVIAPAPSVEQVFATGNRDRAEAHLRGKLHAEVSESADPEDCDGVSGSRTTVTQ